MVENSWEWLENVLNGRKCYKWLEMSGQFWKCLEMAGNGIDDDNENDNDVDDDDDDDESNGMAL